MADVKVTALDALTTPADADLLLIVDDVGGTATSKKVTRAHLLTVGIAEVKGTKVSTDHADARLEATGAGIAAAGTDTNISITATPKGTGVLASATGLTCVGDFKVNTDKFTVAAASGNTVVAGTCAITGNATAAGTLAVTGNTTVGGTLGVTGNTALGGTTNSVGNLTVATNKFVVTAANGNTAVAGTLNSVGNLTVATNKLVVTAADGNTAIAGTCAVVGALTGGTVGYKTGVGGAVTQGTGKTTAVTLNKICGAITMHNAELAAGAAATFTLTNSTIAATDVVVVSIKSGATDGKYHVTVGATAAGSCKITIHNYSAGALSEAVVLNFAVIKAALD